MPTYSEMLKRPARRPQPIVLPSLQMSDMNWGDIVCGGSSSTFLTLPTKSSSSFKTPPSISVKEVLPSPSPPKFPTPTFMRSKTPPPSSPPPTVVPQVVPQVCEEPESTEIYSCEQENAIVYNILTHLYDIHKSRKVCVDDVVDALMEHSVEIATLDKMYINSEISYNLRINNILLISEKNTKTNTETVPEIVMELPKMVLKEESLVEQLLQKRDKYASEATRVPYKNLRYTKSLYHKFHKKSFDKWCDLDADFNYITQSEYYTSTKDLGKWVIYENGKSLKICTTCLEADAWLEQRRKMQAFPFPLWVFRATNANKYTLQDIAIEKKRFEEELIHEIVLAAEVADVNKPTPPNELCAQRVSPKVLPTKNKEEKSRNKEIVVEKVVEKIPQVSNDVQLVVALMPEALVQPPVSELTELPTVLDANEFVNEQPQPQPQQQQQLQPIVTEVTELPQELHPIAQLNAAIQHLLQKIEAIERKEQEPSLLDYLRRCFSKLCTLRKGSEKEPKDS